jgi:hypothetical protein
VGQALVVTVAFCLLAVAAGWVYFRKFRPALPPIGVFTIRDVVVMCAIIVVIPFVYLALPLWAVTLFLGAGFLSALYFTLEPVLRRPWITALVAAVLVGGDICIGLIHGVANRQFQLINNVVLILVVMGATNLWAQSGMKALHVTVLAACLTAYDAFATWHLSVMTDLVERLAAIPLAPVMAWGSPGRDLAVGLGDLVIAAAFPLVMRKAFGRTAGLVALVAGLVVIAAILAALVTGTIKGSIPAMVALGPTAVLQYAWWLRRLGKERTTWQYLQAEPLTRLT